MTAKETEKSFTKLNGWDNKSRVKGDFQARFCERLGLKCPCLLDRLLLLRFVSVKLPSAHLVKCYIYITDEKSGYRISPYLVFCNGLWPAHAGKKAEPY
jgi:hypothetical protein